jgi:hypothetical protein
MESSLECRINEANRRINPPATRRKGGCPFEGWNIGPVMDGLHLVAGSFTPRLRAKQYWEWITVGNYHQLYYHVTWATRERLALIDSQLRQPLHDYLKGKTIDMGGSHLQLEELQSMFIFV